MFGKHSRSPGLLAEGPPLAFEQQNEVRRPEPLMAMLSMKTMHTIERRQLLRFAAWCHPWHECYRLGELNVMTAARLLSIIQLFVSDAARCAYGFIT
jgi:hypothetical protein